MNSYQHIVNVEGAVMKDDRILCVIRSEKEDHAAGLLAFIGGKVEFTDRESDILEVTLKREILEEVGVEIENPRYVTSVGFMTNDGDSVVNLVFVCDWLAGEPRAIDPDEVESVHWLMLDEIRNHEKSMPYMVEYANSIEEFLANSV